MRNENTDDALGVLRQADASRCARGSVEAQLREAFRLHHGRRVRSRRLIFAGALAAGIALCAGIWRIATPEITVLPAPVATLQPKPVDPALAPSTPSITKERPKPVRSANRRATPAPLVAQPVADSDTQTFLAIPYAPPFTDKDRGEVMRVRLPRQAIRSLGLPVNPERLFERVPADVLFGEDGVARGIRLVRSTETK